MSNKRLGFGNVSFWISFLIILLVVLNSVVFIIYQQAHPSENLWLQLWEYFESASFKVVTASLILPILLFLLENHFKVAETIEKNRIERAQKRKEELRERRLEGLALTFQMWNQVFDLTSEVIYFHKTDKEDPRMKELSQRITNFSGSAEEVVNIWAYRFNLPAEIQNLFLVFVNVLICCSFSTIHYIQESDTAEECTNLQESLGVIQDYINQIAHRPVMNVLRDSMELLELKEDHAPNGREQKIQSRIEGTLGGLRDWVQELMSAEIKYNKFLPDIEGEEIEAFRKVAKKVEKWSRKHPGEPLGKCKDYNNFYDSFCKIPYEKMVHTMSIDYSKEYIRYLAWWLGFHLACSNLRHIKTEWPK